MLYSDLEASKAVSWSTCWKFDAWKDSNSDGVVVIVGSEDSTYFSFRNVKHQLLVGLSNQVTCRARGGGYKTYDVHN